VKGAYSNKKHPARRTAAYPERLIVAGDFGSPKALRDERSNYWRLQKTHLWYCASIWFAVFTTRG
jgi:hypothetical protein